MNITDDNGVSHQVKDLLKTESFTAQDQSHILKILTKSPSNNLTVKKISSIIASIQGKLLRSAVMNAVTGYLDPLTANMTAQDVVHHVPSYPQAEPRWSQDTIEDFLCEDYVLLPGELQKKLEQKGITTMDALMTLDRSQQAKYKQSEIQAIRDFVRTFCTRRKINVPSQREK